MDFHFGGRRRPFTVWRLRSDHVDVAAKKPATPTVLPHTPPRRARRAPVVRFRPVDAFARGRPVARAAAAAPAGGRIRGRTAGTLLHRPRPRGRTGPRTSRSHLRTGRAADRRPVRAMAVAGGEAARGAGCVCATVCTPAIPPPGSRIPPVYRNRNTGIKLAYTYNTAIIHSPGIHPAYSIFAIAGYLPYLEHARGHGSGIDAAYDGMRCLLNAARAPPPSPVPVRPRQIDY